MNKEIKRIDQKVQAQLDALTFHEKELDSYFEKRLSEENERERPRVTYIESINTSRNNNRLITEAARELMEFTTTWNLVKEKLDASCLESDQPDAEAFAVALAELVEIKPKDLFKKIARVKRIPRWLKKNTPLRSDLLNQYDFMQRVYKNAPKHLKRMGMSEAQRNAADAASFRMKMRWGGF
jgi:hypothetical protein